VVVTIAEHKILNQKFKKAMPEGFNYLADDPLLRYSCCDIIVSSVEGNWWPEDERGGHVP
jgi:hypothetical protein